MTSQPHTDRVADAVARNWVDRWAPAWAKPYCQLARLDRPIGCWLLLMPCLWSVTLAQIAAGGGLPDLRLLVLLTIGAVAMRGAGCTYNDIVDRNVDGHVARTRSRPIPSGRVSVTGAAIFMVAQSLVGLVVLLQLNRFAIGIGLASLVLVAIYPFMKRVTYWPQIFLGLAFNWGVLVGWVAVLGRLDWAPVVLYVAGIFWTLGYDTIYALQDKEDDVLIGVKSTALRFGGRTRAWLVGFYTITVGGLAAAGALIAAGPVFYLALAGGAAHAAWQMITLDEDDPARCLMLFRSNRDFGLIVFAGLVVASLAA